MKKYFLFIGVSLFLLSCTNDSISDLQNPIANEVEVAFVNNILPIIENQCGACHLPGGANTNYTLIGSASGNISSIINRITRETNQSGFMPQGRSKLSESEVQKFKDWSALINQQP